MTDKIGLMPNKPKTPVRAFRVEDELWLSAVQIAAARGESVSADVLRPALERYVKKHKHELGEDQR